MDDMNSIVVRDGKNRIFNFNSSRDNLFFDSIQNVQISPFKNKKKALRNGDNIVVTKNKIFYLNEEASGFSAIKFIRPVNFNRDSLIENSALFSEISPLPFDLF